MNGTLSQVVLTVSDMDRSVAFYRDRLGLAVREHSAWWSALDAGGGVVLGLHPASTNSTAVPATDAPAGSAVLSFEVANIQAAVDALRAQGLAVDGPRQEEGMATRSAELHDPDGVRIQLLERS